VTRALHSNVDEEGAIHVGWIDGPQGSGEQKRLSIYIDSEDYNRNGDLKVYAIITGPGDHQEMRPLGCPQDVLDVLRDYAALTPAVKK
jgi:hypothetical protein